LSQQIRHQVPTDKTAGPTNNNQIVSHKFPLLQEFEAQKGQC
jgi:hypothetical protein